MDNMIQEQCVQQLLADYRMSKKYLQRSENELRQTAQGSNTTNWTRIFSILWHDRVTGNNAKCFDVLKQTYYDPGIPMILKIRQLS